MIRKGEIIVATRTQYYGCGKTKVYMDAIMKAANHEDKWTETVIVYLSKKREENDNYVRIDTDNGKVRKATEREIELYNAGVRNCKGELI